MISANADQMFLDITPAEAAELPRYTGEMELTNHSAGSLTSQAYQKRWITQRRAAGRRGREGIDCRGMARRAALSAGTAE